MSVDLNSRQLWLFIKSHHLSDTRCLIFICLTTYEELKMCLFRYIFLVNHQLLVQVGRANTCFVQNVWFLFYRVAPFIIQCYPYNLQMIWKLLGLKTQISSIFTVEDKFGLFWFHFSPLTMFFFYSISMDALKKKNLSKNWQDRQDRHNTRLTVSFTSKIQYLYSEFN